MRGRQGTITAYHLAIIGALLAGASAAVTYYGQVTYYGHLLTGFVGFETTFLLLLLVAVVGLRSSQRWARLAAELIAAVAAIWTVGVAISILGELVAGAREPWLPYDCGISLASGFLWAAAVVVARIEDRRPSSQPTA